MSEAEPWPTWRDANPREAPVAAGKILGGSPPAPQLSHTVRVRKGQRLLADGPFAETREQLGGYTPIEAGGLDEAVEIAAGFLGDDSWVSIEVRRLLHDAWSKRGGGLHLWTPQRCG